MARNKPRRKKKDMAILILVLLLLVYESHKSYKNRIIHKAMDVKKNNLPLSQLNFDQIQS